MNILGKTCNVHLNTKFEPKTYGDVIQFTHFTTRYANVS